MVEIKEVATKKEQKAFVEFPLKLYKNNEYYVPALYGDEMKIFKPDYHYYDNCKAVYYIAERDGKVVGRISGIIQAQANEKQGEKRARFTRFDCIDDQEVASALFTAVENWAEKEGMDTVCGPLGFSDLEREGLLIDGFEELSTFEEAYNYPYYQKLIEGVGYEKEVDWLEFKIRCPSFPIPRIHEVAERAKEHYGLRISRSKNTRELVKKHLDGIFYCIDECYKPLYGTVPFTDKMKNELCKEFLLIVEPKYVSVVVDEEDKVVAFGLCFPSIGKAIQKSGGRLTPPALIKLLHSVKHPQILDLGLIGVLPEYQSKGVNAIVIDDMSAMMCENKVDYCETNLNLEYNTKVMSQWRWFEHENHKRRRAFVKMIKRG